MQTELGREVPKGTGDTGKGDTLLDKPCVYCHSVKGIIMFFTNVQLYFLWFSCYPFLPVFYTCP